MQLNSQKPVLDILQVLRGLAALLITAKHALYEVETVYADFVSPEYKFYTLAIDVFFVLSGFIMVYTTDGRSGFSVAKDFMLRRVLRIVPNYWFYTILLALVAFIMPQVLDKASFDVIGFLKSLFFIPYYNSAADLQPFLAVGWSLNYEMYFYFVFAVFLLLPPRYMIYGLTAYFLTTVYVLPHILPDGVFLAFYTKDIVLEFLAGAIIGTLFLRGVRLPAVTLWPMAICAAVVAGFVFVPNVFEAWTGVAYDRGVAAVFILAALILPRGAEFLRAPWVFRFAGDASYTIYLSHAFFIGAVTQFVMLLGLDNFIGPWPIFVVVMLACGVGGGILYLLIEKPMVDKLKDLIRRTKNDGAEKKIVG